MDGRSGFVEVVEIYDVGWNLPSGQKFHLEHLVMCTNYNLNVVFTVEGSQSEAITVFVDISLSLKSITVCAMQTLLLQLISS